MPISIDLVSFANDLLLFGAIALIVFAAAIVQSGAGMGFGLVAAPLFAVIDPALVPGPTLVLGMMSSSWVAIRERQYIVWQEVGIGSIGRVGGVIISYVMFIWLAGEEGFVRSFAILVMLAVIMSIVGWRLKFTPLRLLLMSGFSGLMGTITSVGAPPMALIYQDKNPKHARATLASFFAIGCAFSITGLVSVGRFGLNEVWLSLTLAPIMVVGLLTGPRFISKFDQGYRSIMLAISGIAAIVLFIKSFL